jgi:hypothetical protein
VKAITLILFILCSITEYQGVGENKVKLSTEEIIKDAFLTWTKETNNTSKEFCTEKQCTEKMKTYELKYNCSLMLKEDLPIEKIIFKDINNDGIKDGIITADYEPCEPGTWFINCAMVGHLVFFVSLSESSFKIIEEPKIIRDEIKLGRIKSVENGIINANGAYQSNQAAAHEFDITWTAKFQYKNDRLELISKTKKKYSKSQF